MKLCESGTALAVDMRVLVSKMEESIEAHYQASWKTAQDPDGGPFPAYPSGKSWDEASVKTGSGKKFYHNVISGADLAFCEASYSYTATKGTCKDSSSTVDSVQGSVTGHKDVSTVGERAPMLAVAKQPVSAAIKADQSSFQS